MKHSFITITMLLSPSLAMASGGDVLYLLWMTVVVFLIVVISLFLRKFTAKQRMIVFLFYLAATLISFMATSDMPYSKNMYFINTINTAVPLLAWLAIYVYYIKQSKKH